MRYQLYKEQQLQCSIEEVWTFFSSPYNLAKITPKEMGFIVRTKLDHQAIFKGMEIEYTVSPILKIPMKWKTIITQVKHQKSFTDFQENGPYKYWNHFHEFIPLENGIMMKDRIDYELPLGFLGKVAHRLMVKKKLEDIFHYRQQVLEKLFNQNI